MAGCRFTQEEIALEVGISVPTLKLYYAEELEDGPVKYDHKVLVSLFTAATRHGSVRAATAWIEKVMGIAPTLKLQGDKDNPIAIDHGIDYDKLSVAELEAVQRAVEILERFGGSERSEGEDPEGAG